MISSDFVAESTTSNTPIWIEVCQMFCLVSFSRCSIRFGWFQLQKDPTKSRCQVSSFWTVAFKMCVSVFLFYDLVIEIRLILRYTIWTFGRQQRKNKLFLKWRRFFECFWSGWLKRRNSGQLNLVRFLIEIFLMIFDQQKLLLEIFRNFWIVDRNQRKVSIYFLKCF